MQVSLPYSEINPGELTSIRINNAVNTFVYYINRIFGIFGLLLFFPVLILLIPLLLWTVNTLVKQLIEKFEREYQVLIGILKTDKHNRDKDTLRAGMLFNAHIVRIKNLLIDERNSRKYSSKLVMEKFFEPEDRLIKTLDSFDKDIQKHLQPVSQKEWSQAELRAILPRSKGVPDLNDPEMDVLMERYA